ncbi:ComEA family DNA-binding protein [Corynebacterium sp. HMSC071B10]|uniref:ComEA family DNA-binding protein n=1 Tax=Corynebacterium sp. HMSC071B10 TaxID=1739494 RepID=UPI0008A16C90|nr:ComEA family DNA-binding protein [Corynebacterium sp. HMSC071B10]OFP34580.1 competence protein ComEA [Corynebacterium sp. HMSC071B10]
MDTLDRIKELTRPTGEEDLLNVEYPKPRLSVSPKHACIAVACVLLAFGAWAFLRASPPPETPATWDSAATETESAPNGEIVVSVVGEVERPGLVTLPDGARVADALNAASARPDADIYALNQAQLLVDGQQLVVPSVQAGGESGAQVPDAPADAGGGVLSLNTATAAELTALPGVGEATAQAIVQHRETNGPFAKSEDLMDVKGIGPAKFEALKDLVGP